MVGSHVVGDGIPRHIFISYSREDERLARELVCDLSQAGFVVWMDTSLRPGTPNWDTAIREALGAAYAVVLVASPAAAASGPVAGELVLARARGDSACPIIPVWLGGVVWAESVPVELIRAQYIDCRADQYQSGLAKLIDALRTVLDRRFPKHFALAEGGHDDVPLNHYLTVTLEHASTNVSIRPSAYQSLRAFLDDFYLTYLTRAYPPLTYGNRWVLQGKPMLGRMRPMRLVVTWDWLSESHRNQPISKYNRDWQGGMPSEYGLYKGTSWHIGMPEGAIWGIVTNSKELADEMLDMHADEKGQYALFALLASLRERGNGQYRSKYGSVAMTRPENVDIQRYAWRFVFAVNYPISETWAFVCDVSDDSDCWDFVHSLPPDDVV